MSTKKLSLPEVTLVCVETRNHTLALMTIQDCLDKVEFGDVLILTDRPLEFSALTRSHGIKPRIHTVEDWPSKLGYLKSWWFDVPMLVRTRQTLCLEWDGGMWDTAMWRPEFMDYDYIGAPWWYRDGKNVGNGGFCMMSARLKRYIYDRRGDYPCGDDFPVGDDWLCRKYRPKLETFGFRWAPEKLAHEFAFECCRPSPTSRHFGYHAIYNWPHVLDHKRLIERLTIAVQSDYIRTGKMIQVLWRDFPKLAKELSNLLSTNETIVRKVKQQKKESTDGCSFTVHL